jgi:cell division protein FtsI/penicillin-binding protein 2
MRDVPVTAVDLQPPVEHDLKPFRRLATVLAIFVGFALLIVAQLIRWQVIERAELIAEMKIGLPYREELPSQRGLILDRNRALLALNNYDYTIEAAPHMIPKKEKAKVANQLAAALDRPRDEVLGKLQGDALYSLVERHVPREVGKAVIALHLRGIFVRPLAVRVYPERTLAAHTLGFVAGDKDEGTKGYYGVEGFYDKVLKGQSGVRGVGWDPWEQPVSFADRRAWDWRLPREGHTLVLTVDRTIQYLIEQELHAAVERYGAESGCIVVMDPKTGALLAAASHPAYDPNRFAEIEQDLFVDPIIGRHYEPGSTFKVFTMAAALDTSAVQAGDVYNDIGYIEVGGRILKNWDERSYGLVSMTDILVLSLNTGIAHVSTRLGPGRFYHYVNRFGFGHKTGVDLEGEVSGVTRQQGDAEWHESDLGTNAFGQGLAVTPLQVVVAVGAVANRGFMMQPYVVEQLVQKDRAVYAKQVAIRQVISEETARILTEMMVDVVEDGTTLAKVDGYRIAGKTGTAQTPIVGGYDPNLTIASFVGFAPADDPRFVALVRLDKPTTSPWGAATAAPTFANVARILFTQLAIPPDQARLAAN